MVRPRLLSELALAARYSNDSERAMAMYQSVRAQVIGVLKRGSRGS